MFRGCDLQLRQQPGLLPRAHPGCPLRPWGLRIRGWGLGCGVWGLGVGGWGLWLRALDYGSGSRI